MKFVKYRNTRTYHFEDTLFLIGLQKLDYKISKTLVSLYLQFNIYKSQEVIRTCFLYAHTDLSQQ